VVDCMHHVFPQAVIYTLVYDEKRMPAWFKDYDIRTTWVQKLPFATKLYKNLLPLMPGAFEALDLSEYDLVLSSSSSCSKGVITARRGAHLLLPYAHPLCMGFLLYLPQQRQLAGARHYAAPDPQDARLGQVRRRPGGLFYRQFPLHRPAHQKVLPPRQRRDLPLLPYQRSALRQKGGFLPCRGAADLVQAHRPGGGR